MASTGKNSGKLPKFHSTMKYIALFLLILLQAQSCEKQTDMMRVQLADGSNNTYSILQSGESVSLKYEPMTPAMSSSGVYSGGEPATKKLSKEEWKEVKGMVEKAIAEGESLEGGRSMGTFLLKFWAEGATDPQKVVIPGDNVTAKGLKDSFDKLLGRD